MYGREGEDFTFSAAGDAIINKRISVCEEERVKKLRDIIKNTDVGLVNLETLLHDYEPYPNAECGGMYLRSPRYIADELEWMGFNLFAVANNHIGDYSHGGMISTMNALENRDFTYAGLGRNLREARSPSYLDTSAGNVALVSCCSHFPTGSEAGEQRPDMKGRPGLSPLRLQTKFVVNEEWYEKIKDLSELLGLEEVKQEDFKEKGFSVPREDEDEFVFLHPKEENLSFVKGEKCKISYEINEKDKKAIMREIKRANKQSDWVIMSMHYHAGKNGHINDHSIPKFVRSFARECIDNGADVFVGHGPHVIRGIEIYEDKPIFYSLGNFFFQLSTIERLPNEMYDGLGWFSIDEENFDYDDVPSDIYDAMEFDDEGNPKGFLSDEMFWETILPKVEFKNGNLEKIELFPVELGMKEPRSRRGRPLLREDERGRGILKKISKLSSEFGTEIKTEENKGIIEV